MGNLRDIVSAAGESGLKQPIDSLAFQGHRGHLGSMFLLQEDRLFEGMIVKFVELNPIHSLSISLLSAASSNSSAVSGTSRNATMTCMQLISLLDSSR